MSQPVPQPSEPPAQAAPVPSILALPPEAGPAADDPDQYLWGV